MSSIKNLAAMGTSRRFGNRVYVPVSGLPSTEAGVRAIQDSVVNIANSSGDPKYQFFFQQQIDRLKALQAECLSSEAALYKILGVNSLEDLQNKFQILLGMGLDRLSNVNLDGLVQDIQTAIGEQMDRLIIDILNSNNIKQRIFNDEAFINKTYNFIGGVLQSILKNIFLALGSGNTGFQMKKTKQGSFVDQPPDLSGELTIDNYVEIVNGSIALKKNLSPWMRQRLLLIISGITGTATLKVTTEDLREILKKNGVSELKLYFGIDLRNKIQAIIQAKMGASPVTPLIVNEIERHFTEYALSANPNVIKGFLGEVQFNVLIREVFKDSTLSGSTAIARFFATGNMKDMNGKSFGVDSAVSVFADGILRQFNFQVKNLRDLTNSSSEQMWVYENDASLQSILGRAGIPQEGLLDQFYASWSFNEVFPKDPYHNGWPGQYANTYGRFEEIASRMDRIYLSYADRIMRVDQVFQAQMNSMGLFSSKANYINTFFSLSGKLVPSSRIVGAMIGALNSNTISTMITFDILNVSQNNKTDTANLYSIIMSQNPTGYTVSPNNFSKNVSMKYRITINISQIMNQLA